MSPGAHRLPHDKIRDRAVVDGVTQLLRRQTPFQAQGDLGLGRGTQDVPGFGLAVRQSDRLRIRIVRMNLDGKRLAREQQLEQERRSGGRRTGSLVPDFADRIVVPACAAPRTQICDTPRLWQGMRDRMFNRHNPCFILTERQFCPEGFRMRRQHLHAQRLPSAARRRDGQVQFRWYDRACRWHRRCQLDEAATSVRRHFFCSSDKSLTCL